MRALAWWRRRRRHVRRVLLNADLGEYSVTEYMELLAIIGAALTFRGCVASSLTMARLGADVADELRALEP